ncbi:MAG: hypothetical protein LQ340_003713 [Diploschistes diacapsis]|nr:MAG: hypothetical protein LQ340_003713 [Diploschistes diacapsis]
MHHSATARPRIPAIATAPAASAPVSLAAAAPAEDEELAPPVELPVAPAEAPLEAPVVAPDEEPAVVAVVAALPLPLPVNPALASLALTLPALWLLATLTTLCKPPAAVSTLAYPSYVCRYSLTCVGKARNHDGELPASNSETKLAAYAGSCTMFDRKPEGTAVSSTERTGAVGSTESSSAAMGAMERRRPGLSVGSGMPASEARARSSE